MGRVSPARALGARARAKAATATAAAAGLRHLPSAAAAAAAARSSDGSRAPVQETEIWGAGAERDLQRGWIWARSPARSEEGAEPC